MSLRTHLAAVPSCFLLLLCASFGFAQEGAMKVRVQRPDKAALDRTEQAVVCVYPGEDTGRARLVCTDERGAAYFYKLAPGVYTIRVAAEGFQVALLRTDVKTDHVSQVVVTLKARSPLTVTVEPAETLLDPGSVSGGGNWSGEIVALTPVEPFRRMSDKLRLSPNVFKPGTEFNSDPALINTVNQDPQGNHIYSNNTYVLDGMDISNPLFGTGRTGISDAAIAEIEVKTGGITAEYVARSGAFLQAITISGANTFSGDVSHEFATPTTQARVGKNRPAVFAENGVLQQATVSGPIVKDKLWFAASVFRSKKTQDVMPVQIVPLNEKGAFVKGTWQVSPANRLVLEYHSDYSTGNNAAAEVVPNWVVRTDRGGERWMGWYSFQSSVAMVDVKVGRNAIRTSNVPSSFEGATAVYGLDSTLRLGASGAMERNRATRDQIRVDAAFPFSTGSALHLLKMGAERNTDTTKTTFDILGFKQNQMDSVTYADSLGPTPIVYPAPVIAMFANAYPDVVAAIASNGTKITADDIMAYQFMDLDDPSNPALGYRYTRTIQVGPNEASASKKVHSGFYIQDTITLGPVTFLPGFRLDSYKLKNDIGVTVYTFNNNFAPRMGLTVDPEGNGKSKLFAFFGRYYDTVGMDIAGSIGTTKGAKIQDQIWLAGQWVDLYGSPSVTNVVLDNAKFPHTDELRLGYERSFQAFGATYNLSGTWTRRKDFDSFGSLSQYDYTSADSLSYYAVSQFGIGDNPTPAQTNVIQAFQNLQLPVEYFASGGRSGQEVLDYLSATGAYAYGTIPGQWREHKTFDLTLTRPMQNRWGGMVSYTWNRSRGNSIEMVGSGPVGLMPLADPRLPYNTGTLEGSLDWMAKANVYYKGDHLSFGLSGNWNSGTHYSLSQPHFVGNLLSVTDAEAFNTPQRGQFRTPSVARYDANVAYGMKFGKVYGEVKAGIYNLFNQQSTLREAEGQFVRPGFEFGQGYLFQEPRKVYLGMRMAF